MVIGGGPAGLTAGYLLARAGQPVIVLEAGSQVGGLARTEERDGYRFDLGGHRFFTKSTEVEQLWLEVLGDEFLLRPRMSRIYWNGKFLQYPLQVRDVIDKLGPVELVRSGASYVWAAITPNGKEESFEDWVSNRFGNRLFQLFFKSYTEKVWGVSTSELRSEWAAQRIKGLSFFSAVRNAVMGSRAPEVKSLISEFHYPRFGPGQMWEAMSHEIVKAGGEVRMNAAVDQIEIADGRVAAVHAGGERIVCSNVISSLSLRAAVGMAAPAAPPDVCEAAQGLRYRDFLTVALVLEGEDLFPDNWIYVHEPAVQVGRIQNYRSWSPWMVPDDSTACVGLEYFCFRGDDLWNSSDELLVALATTELRQLGLIDASTTVRQGYVIRVPLAYPMYDADYADRIALIRTWLSGIENLQQVGRNGLHRYNNSDHSMLTAVRAVDNLLSGASHDIWEVNVESSYHEEETVEQQPYRAAPATQAMREPLVHVFRPSAADAAPAGQASVPTCSVIVPATNNPITLVRCLAAVRAAISTSDELLVIDDLETHSPACIRNEGARRARGDIVVFVDADVIPNADAIDELRAALADGSGISAAFGSYDDDPPPGLVSQFRNLLHHHVHQESPGDVETFWAGLGAVRRDVFLAAGGFDGERFPRPMLEDVEFGLRLSETGGRIVLLPHAQCRHLKRWTLRRMITTDFRDRGIPWTRLLIERRRAPASLNLGWHHRFSALSVLATPIAFYVTRRRIVPAVGLAALVALNHRFYRLLARRDGWRLAVAGVPLHILHHASAIAALPFGVVAHIRRGGATARPEPLERIIETSPRSTTQIADQPAPR